jgi:cytochrome P450
MTLLLAGHETTANALSWTWYLLSMHPEAERRLRAELAEVLGGRMVLQESMRLYPPVWGISRNAVADDEILGYRIPGGSRSP